MASKTKPCTLAPKHTWAWKRNVTLKFVSMTPSGTTMRISYRGDYRCYCGEQRYGRTKEPSDE